MFCDRVNATLALEAADAAIRAHPCFKRAGEKSSNPFLRRNFVLGHPDDMDREIELALMFAVFPHREEPAPG